MGSDGAALAAQYSTYHPFADLALNGQQTLSENLADLAGLAAAYDGLHATKPAAPEALKCARSSGVHQSRRRPCESNCAP